ncbi:MAG: aminoacyl-tRNA hydrolase [Caldilineaceae bacterium]|nr:aminoacyl-tRNA hydrolase [Caldilineaceae bacterium]MBP8107948.1 aminoacyl-tRNA hydrolase [Caldilineaceae bacterium]MBP8122984.1 aminoacyl-tRNA hydrolase [Caldilineaceae bacterium]MBP9073021.1 aminoacyl-tRNA hydrolase [Caldilineaceae bacterium]
MSLLHITNRLTIPLAEIQFDAVRSQGAGGQNVNKVASAIQLRYDIAASSLPDEIKERLLAISDQRITQDGVVVIKAQSSRRQEQNRAEALSRLQQLVRTVAVVPKRRRPTRPSRSAKRKRIEKKKQRGAIKKLRGSVDG